MKFDNEKRVALNLLVLVTVCSPGSLEDGVALEEGCQVKSIQEIETPLLRTKILEFLNALRNQLAAGYLKHKSGRFFPRASDMMELRWDEDLSDLAASEAKYICHNGITSASSWDAESALTASLILTPVKVKEEFLFENVFKKRFHEAKDQFPVYSIEIYKKQRDYKDFTVIGMAKTKLVGCVFVSFFEPNETVSQLCAFGPSEKEGFWNVLYTPGEPCSNCPSGSVCSPVYTSLCREAESSAIGDSVHLTESRGGVTLDGRNISTQNLSRVDAVRRNEDEEKEEKETMNDNMLRGRSSNTTEETNLRGETPPPKLMKEQLYLKSDPAAQSSFSPGSYPYLVYGNGSHVGYPSNGTINTHAGSIPPWQFMPWRMPYMHPSLYQGYPGVHTLPYPPMPMYASSGKKEFFKIALALSLCLPQILSVLS